MLVDEFLYLRRMVRLDELSDPRIILHILAGNEDIGIGRIAVLTSQRIPGRYESGRHCIVAVDCSDSDIIEGTGNLCRLALDDFQILLVLNDVSRSSLDAETLLQLD